MKSNLRGLLEQAGSAAKKGDKRYGGMYAYSLQELYKHIQSVIDGDHTIEEFADFYCMEKSKVESE